MVEEVYEILDFFLTEQRFIAVYSFVADRIHSPEKFIELAATRSMLSGKEYTVRGNEGETPTAEWLRTILAEYRDARNSINLESE